MSEFEVPEHAETRSSSFPISSPTFWNEAAKVSTPPPPSKRERSPEDEGRNEDEGDEGPAKRAHHRSPTTTLAYLPNRTGPIDVDDPHAYLVNAEYAPNRFGDIGDYMRKKEIKVQTQNRDIAFASAASGLPQIFAGLSFYINGNTHPPMEELRKMILQRGGEVRPVLRSKGMVKFIIAPMLTQSKFKQFERYRVVREGWITESCKEEKLLDWSRWKLKIIGGWEEGSKKGMEGFLKGQAILKGQASQMREAIKEDDLEDDTPPPPDPALPVPALPHQLLSASNRSLLVTPRSSPIPISSGIVRDLTANDRPGAKLESPPTPARSSPLASPTKDELIAHDETLRPPKTATIPISPGAVRGETPAKEKTPAKVHKPEGAWEYYYSKESNEDAARLLKNQEWRLKNTAERGNEGGFIDGYYQNSRLHHLSTWKAELKVLVAAAQRQSEEQSLEIPSASSIPLFSLSTSVLPKAAQVTAAPGERIIFHVDFDCFFVSCGLATRPHLKGKPSVVCHSQAGRAASSTSEIASASYEARAKGVKNAMSLGRARTLVGDELQTIPYEFDTYKKFSLAFYTVLMGYADELQAVSVDEALIDVTSAVTARAIAPEEANEGSPDSESPEPEGRPPRDPAVEIAEKIRDDVRRLTDGCEVSIGIAHNIFLAKLATRRAKPAGVFHLLPLAIQDFLAPLDVEDFPSIGYSIKSKVQEKFGITLCENLLEHSRRAFQAVLGPKTGDMLYGYLRGMDDRKLEPHKERKSISAEMNYGIRFRSHEQAEICVADLAAEVAKRMKQVNARGRLLTLKLLKRHPDAPIEPPKFLGHGWCETFNKSAGISNKGGSPTDDPAILGVESVKLLRAMKLDPVELRGVGIQITKLEGEAKAAERQPGQGMLPFGAKKESASVSADTERKETARQSHSLSSAELDIEPDTEVIHHPETLSADAGSRRSPEQNDAVDQIEPGSTTPILAEQGVQEEAPLEAIGVGPVIPEASALRISRSARSTSRGYLAEDSVIAGPSRLTTSSDGIDPDFLAALPAELRLEVKRDFARTRAASETPPPPPPNPDRGPRATTISPAKPKGMHAAAHITRQLRPKMKTQLKASAVADLPLYGAWAKAKEKDDAVDLTAENDSTIGKYLASELRELDIDPDVFAELPAEMQNEVVLEERRKHKQRKILHRPADRSRFRSRERQSTRSASLSPSRSSRAGSVPLQYAKPQPRITITRLPKPALLKAVSLPDVLETVTRWIESRGESGPAPRDAGKVRTYLMKCMGPGIGLGGVENVVEVLKWMRSVLLERWEEDGKENRQAGKEWWATWRGFKDEVDRISLRRFGAPIRL